MVRESEDIGVHRVDKIDNPFDLRLNLTGEHKDVGIILGEASNRINPWSAPESSWRCTKPSSPTQGQVSVGMELTLIEEHSPRQFMGLMAKRCSSISEKYMFSR